MYINQHIFVVVLEGPITKSII